MFFLEKKYFDIFLKKTSCMKGIMARSHIVPSAYKNKKESGKESAARILSGGRELRIYKKKNFFAKKFCGY